MSFVKKCDLGLLGFVNLQWVVLQQNYSPTSNFLPCNRVCGVSGQVAWLSGANKLPSASGKGAGGHAKHVSYAVA